MTTQLAQIDGCWQVSGEVVIGTVSAILNASKVMPIAAGAAVNFAEVTNIDTSAISLILEWKRRAQQEKHPLKFVNLPANLVSLTELYGVSEIIN
jgi:phospholipid transport system transporter-binding protein